MSYVQFLDNIPVWVLFIITTLVFSIAAYLTDKFNVSVGQIVTQWYGKADPVASNDTIDGRRQNRRVEAIVMGFD